jgi:hypothetical protein
MKVNVDFIPTISDLVSEEPEIQALINRLNIALTRLNEILRMLAVAINTVEFLSGTEAENVYCDYVTVSFGTAGTELSASHSLLKIPSAIVGTKLDRMGDMWFSKAATSTDMYLKSDTDDLSGSIIII